MLFISRRPQYDFLKQVNIIMELPCKVVNVVYILLYCSTFDLNFSKDNYYKKCDEIYVEKLP